MKTRIIAVTGAAGQIAYSLVFRLANGDLFGPNQPIALRLLDIPDMVPSLKGLAMELDDCAFPLLKEVKTGSSPEELFEGADIAFLIGSKPRSPGMERKDLLAENGKIFVAQGKALNTAASKEVRVLVVGNPCNTNCLIAMRHAPDLPRNQFHAMTRLDQNRATAMLAKQAHVDTSHVRKVTIWGNHSSTQVPDFIHARIDRQSAEEVIRDRKWLETTFFKQVQQRGTEVMTARGKSSAASAAHAALSAMRALFTVTREDEWFSSGVVTDGNPYGIAGDLVFSFPCRSRGQGDFEIVPNLTWDPFLQQKISLTEKELREERDMVKHLL